MAPFGDIVGLFFMVGGIALALVWFFVPFAIFGTKSRLDELIDELEKTNQLLSQIKGRLDPAAPPAGDPDEIPSIRVTR